MLWPRRQRREPRVDTTFAPVSIPVHCAHTALVDPNTLVTVVRYVERGSDFHSLARFLETYVNE